MKKNDIALLVLVAAISLVVAYLVGNAFLGATGPGEAKVETVEPISAEVVKPDASIFNSEAINPSVPIKIGDTTNQQPFGQ